MNYHNIVIRILLPVTHIQCITTGLEHERGVHMAKRWHYMGDINLEYGGYFWREDGADDYVLCVRVTPCSDAGGPNNLFWIEQGSIYMDATKRQQCLSVIGE